MRIDSRSWWIGYFMGVCKPSDVPPAGVDGFSFFSGVIEGRASGRGAA